MIFNAERFIVKEFIYGMILHVGAIIDRQPYQ